MPSHSILINPSDITLSDRSVQYGDASFTTMYCAGGVAVLFDAHIHRLKLACNKLDIRFNDWDELQRLLFTLIDEDDKPTVIKVLITRGSGGRGYDVPDEQAPRCIITTHETKAMQEAGDVHCLKLSSINLPSHSHLEGIKHNNRLAQVMAKKEAKALGCDEVLMCDHNLHVIEASSANIFYCINGVWHTPPLAECGVQGVMRDAFIDHLLLHGRAINYATHHISQFKEAEHILLSNAVKGLRAVQMIDIDSASFSHAGTSHDYKKELDTDLDDLINPFIASLFNQSVGEHSKLKQHREKAL